MKISFPAEFVILDIQIDNETGWIFRGHYILEYKSAEDELDILS